MIRIWKFEEAPPRLKELYPQATLETWVMESPMEDRMDAELMLEVRSDELGDIVRHEMSNGEIVFFGTQVSAVATAAHS